MSKWEDVLTQTEASSAFVTEDLKYHQTEDTAQVRLTNRLSAKISDRMGNI